MAEPKTEAVPDPEEFAEDSPNPTADAELAVLGDALQEQGVTRVVIRYEGIGDSGGVDAVEVEPEEVVLPAWLEDQLRTVAESYCPDGYEINDGGYGSLTIHPALGLAEREHYDCYEDSEAMDVDTATLPENLQQQLTALGVHRVHLHFDGYGDSGQIENVEVQPEGITLDEELQGALEEFLLERLPGGWEINEGSFGAFTVEVASGEINVDAYDRLERDSNVQVTRWTWRK